MNEIMALTFLALALGFVSSFLGIGGGSIAVPVLYSFYPNATPVEVISTSLGSIFFITSLNSIQYALEGLLPHWKKIIPLAIMCLLGGMLGSSIVFALEPGIVKKIFGFTLLIIMAKSILHKPKESEQNNQEDVPIIQLMIIGLLGSLLSSITGLGGGIIFTPAFLEISKLRIKRVAPYANIAMVFATGAGLIAHLTAAPPILTGIYLPHFNSLQLGNVNISVVLFLGIGSLISSRFGVKLNGRVSKKTKKRILLALLLVLSLKTLIF